GMTDSMPPGGAGATHNPRFGSKEAGSATARVAHQLEEAHLLVGIVAEDAAKLRRYRRDALLLHAPHGHAHMLRLDHDRDAARLQVLVDRRQDLRGQMLLRLQTARIHVDDARDLREAHYPLDREVGDMRAADHRKHVVLAVGIKGNVTNDDEIVEISDLAEGAVENLIGLVAITAEDLLERLDQARRRLPQTLAVRVIADPGDQCSRRSLRRF